MKRRGDIGVFVFGLVLGVTLGLVFAYVKAFKYENTLTLGDCLEASVAVAVVTIIYSAAGQLSDRRKFLVGLITDELRAVLERIESIEQFFSESAAQPKSLVECHRTLFLLRQAVNRMHVVKKQLELLGLSSATLEACSELQTTLGSFRQDLPDQFPVDAYTAAPAEIQLHACGGRDSFEHYETRARTGVVKT
jgi:hypothetical protein